jgi:hypothetical protein
MKSLLTRQGRSRWAVCVLLVCNSAFAQYSIDWFTVDSGGGTTSGGVYKITGTIGQPDAGSVTAVTNPPVVANGEKQVTVSPLVGNRYYRLKYEP